LVGEQKKVDGEQTRGEGLPQKKIGTEKSKQKTQKMDQTSNRHPGKEKGQGKKGKEKVGGGCVEFLGGRGLAPAQKKHADKSKVNKGQEHTKGKVKK